MFDFQSIQRSARCLMLHRLRSLLSTLGILFGVTAVVAMLSIGEGAKRETLEQIEQLGLHTMIIKQNNVAEDTSSYAKRSSGLTHEDAHTIYRSISNVTEYAPIKIIKATIPNTLQEMAPEILAVTRSYGTIKSIKMSEGRFLCDVDQQNRQLVCVLGHEVAHALGPMGHPGKTLRIENAPYQIVGVLERNQWKASKNLFLANKNLNQAIFIPLGSEGPLASPLHPDTKVLSEIILQVKPHTNLNQTSNAIKSILRHQHGDYQDYQIFIPQELLQQANQTQHTFNLVLGSIAAISLLVGGIGIMNMMLANVTERVREIGIRRALGATKQDIMLQFLTEAMLLTLFGACLGVLFGISFSFLIGYLAGWTTVVTIWSVVLSVVMASGVGICSGLYPAYKAAILHPIVALR
ncbi:MAG: ABC transporter permease [Parachlamydiaceae bacterium]|nr:ABC transporter permease [Parachlamydiaceae bacterium]